MSKRCDPFFFSPIKARTGDERKRLQSKINWNRKNSQVIDGGAMVAQISGNAQMPIESSRCRDMKSMQALVPFGVAATQKGIAAEQIELKPILPKGLAR